MVYTTIASATMNNKIEIDASKKKVSDLMSLKLNNTDIIRRSIDGFINATALCQAGGKQINEWSRRKKAKSFLSILSTHTENPIDELYIQETGSNENRRTWVHPQIAINIAQWISPEFDVQVSKWIYELGTFGKVELNNEHSNKEIEQMRMQLQIKEQDVKSIEEKLNQEKKTNETLALELEQSKRADFLKMEAKCVEIQEKLYKSLNLQILFDDINVGYVLEFEPGFYKFGRTERIAKRACDHKMYYKIDPKLIGIFKTRASANLETDFKEILRQKGVLSEYGYKYKGKTCNESFRTNEKYTIMDALGDFARLSFQNSSISEIEHQNVILKMKYDLLRAKYDDLHVKYNDLHAKYEHDRVDGLRLRSIIDRFMGFSIVESSTPVLIPINTPAESEPSEWKDHEALKKQETESSYLTSGATNEPILIPVNTSVEPIEEKSEHNPNYNAPQFPSPSSKPNSPHKTNISDALVAEEQKKQCIKCKIFKPYAEMHLANRGSRQKVDNVCNACRNNRAQQRNLEAREKRMADPEYKRNCKVCNKDLPEKSFYRHTDKSCIDCINAKRRAKKRANPSATMLMAAKQEALFAEGKRFCTKCKEEKPLSEFTPMKGVKKIPYSTECHICRNKKSRDLYKATKPRFKNATDDAKNDAQDEPDNPEEVLNDEATVDSQDNPQDDSQDDSD